MIFVILKKLEYVKSRNFVGLILVIFFIIQKIYNHNDNVFLDFLKNNKIKRKEIFHTAMVIESMNTMTK